MLTRYFGHEIHIQSHSKVRIPQSEVTKGASGWQIILSKVLILGQKSPSGTSSEGGNIFSFKSMLLIGTPSDLGN